MSRWPNPKPPAKYFIILIAGAFFLPISPLLSIAVIFLLSHIDSLPSIEQIYLALTRKKRIQKREQKLREEAAQKAETVFFCRSCGAVYTAEFLKEFSLPEYPHTNKSNVSVQNPCYYCGNEISVSAHPQGYYEQQANEDDLNILGEAFFSKPLRYRNYVLQENQINPQPELLENTMNFQNKQIFIHFGKYLNIYRRINAYPGSNLYRMVVNEYDSIEETCRKYDQYGSKLLKEYDIIYENPVA